MKVKCGRIVIVKNDELDENFGIVPTEEFEHPVCVATLHTEGNNQTGLPYVIGVSITTENTMQIGISNFDGTSVSPGTYYIDYIVMEATNAVPLTVG